ncbi:MAG: 50S ribosomal protein L11 methyltransferase [Sandaracinaceae bacterium]|nr:MAG: 50S ribosomal protein L11 methyltransferase [Sandaracinaceae bacterium]
MSEPRYPCVHVAVPVTESDVVSSVLWDAGATGLEERDATTMDAAAGDGVTLVAHFDEEADALEAVGLVTARFDGRFVPTVEHIVGDDWRERWKAFFHTTRVGERLVVRPSWETHDAREGDLVIVLDPGQAFGTGTHETTRLVMRELEARVSGGEHVLDVGCGSGILGIAALKLGAARVVAVDVDPIAVRVTDENAEINGVAIEASTTPIEDVPGRYPIVLANIRSPILIPMTESLVAHLTPGGVLVLSGLLAEEESEIRAVYDAHLRFDGVRRDGDWIALAYRSEE